MCRSAHSFSACTAVCRIKRETRRRLEAVCPETSLSRFAQVRRSQRGWTGSTCRGGLTRSGFGCAVSGAASRPCGGSCRAEARPQHEACHCRHARRALRPRSVALALGGPSCTGQRGAAQLSAWSAKQLEQKRNGSARLHQGEGRRYRPGVDSLFRKIRDIIPRISDKDP